MAMRRVRLRPTLRWVHRWLGLTVGTAFAVVGLSGSLLLFQPHYFKWAHGHMIPADLSQEPGSLDAWVARGRAAAPGLGDPIVIWRPHISHNVSDAGLLIYSGIKPGGFGNMGLLGVLVAPATGSVLGTVAVDTSPAYAPLFLHRDLWGGETGKIVNGAMAAGSVVLLSIGLYLWWPGTRGLRRKLSPRPWRKTLRIPGRLHDWAGAWTLIALLVLSVSGLYLVRPGWMDPVLAFLPDHEESTEAVSREPCPGRIGFDTALARAGKLVPGATWTGIFRHIETAGLWEIAMRTGDDLDAVHGDVRVIADLGCGRVQLHESAATRPARHTAETILAGLHDGAIFGIVGEVLVTMVGLVPAVMCVTGLIMWLNGRAPRRRTAGAAPAGTDTIPVEGDPVSPGLRSGIPAGRAPGRRNR